MEPEPAPEEYLFDEVKGEGARGSYLDDERLPPAGSVLQKRDRYGEVTAECTILEDGIHYRGKVYQSLSAAAKAAATDMGLSSKAINGYAFWGLRNAAQVSQRPIHDENVS